MKRIRSKIKKPPLIAPTVSVNDYSPNWRVAVIANVKDETPLLIDAPADAGAEFDAPETIAAIQEAIASDGHQVAFLPANKDLPFALQSFQPDICFNIAEGVSGDGREAQVPALLEMLQIPYTASRVVTSAISLDKTLTKRLWREQGLPVAPFQEFRSLDTPLNKELEFPLFVKPSSEGTGMGMDTKSIVYNQHQLQKRISWIINEYHQPALVEEYLTGREFTVGVLGNTTANLFSRFPFMYDQQGYHCFPVQEIDCSQAVTAGVYGHLTKTLALEDTAAPRFLCPAPISKELTQKLQNLAIKAHQSINAQDVSRVDIRLDKNGRACLIEINTLPGLTPDFSDLCILAKADDFSYRNLILEILYLAAGRYGLLTPQPIHLLQKTPVIVHH